MKPYRPYRVEDDQAIRIVDPRRGIALHLEKNPRRKIFLGLVLVRADRLEVAGPIYLELGLS